MGKSRVTGAKDPDSPRITRISGGTSHKADGRSRKILGKTLGMKRRRGREYTVYDAVAGEYHGRPAPRLPFFTDLTRPGTVHHDKQRHGQDAERDANHTTNETPHSPGEILFRRKWAPERYAEHDIYRAHERDLPSRDVLPDSDMLKAIHSHACRPPPGRASRLRERSMDGTALLALGILLEEAGRHALGRQGDLVLTEEAEDTDGEDHVGTAEQMPEEAAGMDVVRHDDDQILMNRPRKRMRRSNDGEGG